MELNVKHQETYSRSELLLRALLGAFYIALPHIFVLMFIMLWGGILNFIAFWAILFTGKHPQSMFEYQLNTMRWNLRLNASLSHLVDGYPAFGLSATSEDVVLNAENPETLSRGNLLLKAIFGFIYVLIPHAFILAFRQLWGAILGFIAFWVVLFTGKFPASTHEFLVENLRWGARVNLYMKNMTDEYPPFSGKA